MADILEELDIDLDDGFETIKTKDKVESIDEDISVDLDEINTPVVDELKEELSTLPKKDDLADIDISLESAPVKAEVSIPVEVEATKPKESIPEDIDISLDDFVEVKKPYTPPAVAETKQEIITTIESTTSAEVRLGNEITSTEGEEINLNEEIDVDQSSETKESDKPKRGRKPKAVKNTSGLKNGSSRKKYTGFYDPVFVMSKITTGKYNVRHTLRTPEEIADLASDIKMRGQLEPIHLAKEGEEYHLIAGYGRFEAMNKLGIDTCRAIYYDNLQSDDIFGIATGTNQKRAEFTAWDNIVSFVKFVETHKNIPITSTDESEQTVCSIFGVGKTTAYSYVEIYDFLKTKDAILAVLKEKKIPFHALNTIYENRKQIMDTNAIPKVADVLMKTGETTRAQFKEIIDYIIGETSAIKLGEIAPSSKKSDIDKEISISPEVDKITMKEIEKDVTKIALEKNVESIKVMEENKKFVNDKLKSLQENFTFINQSLLDVLSKDGLTNLIDPDLSSSLKKKAKELAGLISKVFV